MGLQVRLVGVLITLEAGRAHNVAEHIADVTVQLFLRNGAILHTGDDAVYLVLVTGFHEVVACLGALDGTCLVAPVRHHDTLEAPFVAQDSGKKAFTLLGVIPVELVIGTHHRPGLGFLHGNLEVLEVDFPQGTLGNDGVVLVAVGFLVVGSVVLDGSSHAVALDALYISGSHLAGKERILGEILEVTAAQRVAVDIHTGSQEYVHAVFQHFVAHGLGDILHQGKVPGAGQKGAHRETGTIIGMVISRTGGLDAETRRAVGQDGGRDAQTLDRAGVTGGTGDIGRDAGSDTVHHGGTGAAHQKGGLLLKGHGLKDVFDVVFTQTGLCHGDNRQGEGSQRHKGFLHIVMF